MYKPQLRIPATYMRGGGLHNAFCNPLLQA